MTILDQITHEAESLSTTQQQQALRLIRSLRTPKPDKNGKSRTTTSSPKPTKFSELFRPLAGLKIKRSRERAAVTEPPPPHIVDLLLAAPHASDFKLRRSGSKGRKPTTFD